MLNKKCLSILIALVLAVSCLGALAEAALVEQTAEVVAVLDSLEKIDKYGDPKLSITSGEFAAAGFQYEDLVTVRFAGQEIVVPVVPEYRYVAAQHAGLVMWKDAEKPVELEIFNGSFAGFYGLATKTTNEDKTFFWTANEGIELPLEFSISLYEEGGYHEQYLIYDLGRTDEKSDYPSLTDEQFANFRAVTTTGMGENKLFRASSPVNPSIGRNAYADDAARAHQIKTVVNLADDQASAEKYENFANTYYSALRVIYLNLGVDFAKTNVAGLADGLRGIGAGEAPFLIHCNEGQDRAGFTAFLLESLMGASYEELKADYMTTYFNYYGVMTDSEQYNAIWNNVSKSLAGYLGIEQLEGADLVAAAEAYVLGTGLTQSELEALKAALR